MSLIDDWKKGTLRKGWYCNKNIQPMYVQKMEDLRMFACVAMVLCITVNLWMVAFGQDGYFSFWEKDRFMALMVAETITEIVGFAVFIEITEFIKGKR